jgi:CheY-like chemotaxis protein
MSSILVVDDSSVDRRFVGGLLQRSGNFDVEFAEDGQQALDKLKNMRPDVVLTDLQMPGRGGLELVAAVRVRHPGVPVILMTGQGSETLAVEALQRGAANYIPKAQLGERLLNTIDEALAMVRADRTYERLIACLRNCEFEFELDNDPALIDPLVDLVQQMISGMTLTDATGRFRVGAALKEALLNAIYRGNLEISFDQMQDTRESLLMTGCKDNICKTRRQEAPYCDRRVRVRVSIDSQRIEIVVADQGPGFDPATARVAQPVEKLDPELGRGLLIMRSFMDDVRFNERGNEVTLVKRREILA